MSNRRRNPRPTLPEYFAPSVHSLCSVPHRELEIVYALINAFAALGCSRG